MRACADDAMLSGSGDTEPALHAWIADLRATADAPAPAPTTALATLLRTGRPPVPAAVPAASRFPLRVRARRVVARAAALGVAGKLALGTGVAFASVGAVATVEAVPDSLQDPASAVVVELVDALTLGTVELTPHGSRPAGTPLGGPRLPGAVVPALPDSLASTQGPAPEGRTGSAPGTGTRADGVGAGSPSVTVPGPRATLPTDLGDGAPRVTVPGGGVPGELPGGGVPPGTAPGVGNGNGNGLGLGAAAGSVPGNGLPQVAVPPGTVPGPPADVPGAEVAVPGANGTVPAAGATLPGAGAGAGAGAGVGVGGARGSGPGTGTTGADPGPGGGSPASDAHPGQGRGRPTP